MPDLLKQVKDTIRKHEMLSGGEAVVAAVSGGADSVVMLHALWSLRDELKLKIIVAHLDHGLRGAESRRDYLFVKGLARSMGLPFEGRRLKKGTLKAIGGSVQEAARNIRYEFLDEVARKFKAGRIILGHTLDDQAETVLMRLIKGASLSGLTGIPPKREKYIRPLIETKRDDIEGYAGEAGLKFVVDSSNLEAKYLRNRIRLGLIPALKKEYNPKITETIARTAALLADDDDYLEGRAKKTLDSALVSSVRGSVTLDRKRLLRLHQALSSRVFLMAARLLGRETELLSAHVGSFLSIVKGRRPNASVKMPGGLRAERVYDRVTLTWALEEEFPEYEVEILVPGRTMIAGAGVIVASILKPPSRFKREKDAAWFDYALLKASGRLIARQARPGDRMVPFGMKGRRKLKDIFIDEKVPMADRKRTPVVICGESIIWVAGLRQSAGFRVGKGIKKALKLEFRRE